MERLSSLVNKQCLPICSKNDRRIKRLIRAVLLSRPAGVFKEQLHGKGNSQPYGLLGARVDAAAAMGTEFRIGDLGNIPHLGSEKHIFCAILRAGTACRAFFPIYDRRHGKLLSYVIKPFSLQ